MLSAWLNSQITVQRRDKTSAPNVLGEPAYGNEAIWPTVYSNIDVRIEYNQAHMEFTEIGERVVPNDLEMYVEDGIEIEPEDRVIITQMDDPNLIDQLYIVHETHPEWDSVGNRHHTMVFLGVH